MNSSDRMLAGRYGKALFLAAKAAGQDARAVEDLSAAQDGLREFLPLLKNPQVGAAEKKALVDRRLSKTVSPLSRKFLKLLIDKKRFDLLPAIRGKLGRLWDEANKRGRAKVWAAQALSAEQEKALKARLEKFFGRTVEMEIKQDPEIIGGLVVRLGDWVLDSSLRGQLRSLGETLNGD
ncbi:MAG: ATP synthase F1 subunit delta [Elusimicrobia bacterium]|nr:ATP synthase F1 subunit delta [Elusimicrobiota bacterium]MDE2312591.1 ATP synthase F1 subunit delta [Elusimicrobiota bacterium]